MASQSAPPPNASDEKFQNPGDKIVQSTNMDPQNSREEPVKQSSTSVFVHSEPMREEQVQNAVKFLSHPKVRGSPVIYRRSFLEKKGLTKEEIDEAFRRVPDSHPNMQTAGENQDGQLKSSSNIQQQAPAQVLQPGASASTGTTTLATLSRPRFHWSHTFIAIGFLAASGAGTALLIKKSILPWLKSWIRKVVLEDDPMIKIDSKPSLAEETAQAAKAAAAAAADVAKVSQEMLMSHSEERRYIGELVTLVDNQVQEMKLMTNAIRRLEASSGATLSDRRVTQESSKQLIANGKVDYDLHSGRNSSTSASAQPSTAPHPKSYMEIMAMVQRGEKPSNIRDINDLPPNPDQQPSNPRLAPRTKPWEVNQMQHTTTQVLQSQQVNGEYLNSKVQDTTIQVNNDDSPAPWWQKKNVRIREIDNEDEAVPSYYSAPSVQQPVKRMWVPPQPPPIAMPGAAEAIRRPKPAAQKDPMPDDQSVHSSDTSDESQRVPKISEPEGAIEGSNLSSMPISSEIQEVQ